MRRHAKAPSAAEAMHSGTGRELGSAPLRFTLLALVSALSLALLTAPAARANGNLDVTVVGSGSGTVTSTSEQLFFGSPFGSGIVTPGQINCSKAGGPVCSANFAHEFGEFSTEVNVTLTATPDPGGGPFAGWAQADGTPSTRCTTPPEANPTCVLALNGNPGPSAKVFAVFGDPPGPPSVVTDGSTPGSAFHLATMEGRVNPNGLALLDCRFLYGTTTDYGQSAPCTPSAGAIGNGTSEVAVTADTAVNEPLEPDTTYHFRLRATGGLGAADEGEDMTFTTGLAPADSCPNADIRAEQGVSAILLPDCMAIEQVSPQKKDNQPARIRFVEGNLGAVLAGSLSADGEKVRFLSTAALAGTPGNLDAFGDTYISSRDEGGEEWNASHTNPPVGMTRGWYGPGVETARPVAFSADFSHWFQTASTPDQFEAGLTQLFRGELGEESTPFTSLLAPLSGSPGGTPGNVQVRSRGSSADSSHLYFSTEEPIAYLPGDPLPAGSGALRNTYVTSLDSNGDPSLGLLARDGNGKVWGGSCGAQPGGGNSEVFAVARDRGAISADGSRTYLSTRPSQPSSGACNTTANKLRILKRVETAEGPWISELISSECDRVANLPAVPACGTVGPSGTAVPDGDDIYEGASIEGSKLYFTTSRQLADSDTNGFDEFGFSSGCSEAGFFGPGGCDLYLYDAKKPSGERLTQVTAAGNGRSIPKVVSISGDGSHAYFTSPQVLTATPGPEGKVAQAGQANLYLFEQSPAHPNGRVAFVAPTNPGSAYPVPVLGEDPTEIGVGGDGHLLVFTSSAALTADDLDGMKSDLFRYDAEDGTLVRISKAAPGGTDNGPFNAFAGFSLGGPGSGLQGLSGSPDFVVHGRWVSEDGETISFRTQDGLVPEDQNGILDSYVYRDGDPHRLPGTADSSNGLSTDVGLQDGPQVSTDGDLVAFQSFQQLLARDRDTAVDVYAIRVEGGFPEPPEPVICSPDSQGGCRRPAGGPIGEASGVSATLVDPGNLRPKAVPKRCPKGKRKVRRKGKVRCVQRKAAKAKKAKSNRNANTDRRAGK